MKFSTAFIIISSWIGIVLSKSPLPCPSGQFMMKNQCVLCHPTCSECAGHELFDCTTCGVDEDGQERFLHQGHCRTHCPRGLYPDRGHYACLPCIANCELCTDAHICAKCQEHYKLQNGFCQTANCGLGQVQDPDTGECIDCVTGCKTCSTDDPEICNSCIEGYFLFRHQCRRHCPQSTYEDRGRGVCWTCPAPCADCRSSTHCLACQHGHFLSDRECVKQCPQRTFHESNTWHCQSCHSSCQSCHGPRSTDCDLCLDGSSSLHGQCPLVNCPQGQYLNGKYGECHTCDDSCKTCFGPQAMDCSSCFTGYFLDQESSCVEHCPIGTYANRDTQLCEDCSPNCEACMDTSDKCISCSKGKLFLHQGRCWSNCPEAFFETAEGSCAACDSSCRTCDGSASQCLSCPDGRYLESGSCGLNCSLRTYAGEDGTCRRCPPHCDVCSDDRTCVKCGFLYLSLNGTCKASCPVGYYEDMDEGHCGLCHTSCSKCSGPMADDCEACSALTPRLFQGVCSKECPAATFYDPAAAECQECHQTCASCLGPEASQCTQCEKGLVLDPNTLLCGVTGDTGCPPKTYLHDDQFTCVACHHHCRSCGGPGRDDCQTCAVPKYLHNGTCVTECPGGTYSSRQDADGTELGFCRPCSHVCSSCTGASPRDCLTCSPGYQHLLHLCLPHCPTGYYSEGSGCEKCDTSCLQCTGAGPGSCRACLLPLLELHGTGLCVERCPQRFYQVDHTCKQCHASCLTCTDASPQSCVTCDRGSTLKENVCYPHCEEGHYYTEEESCEPCDSSCRHCFGAGPAQCLTCHSEFALHAAENRCTRCCPAGANASAASCCPCDPASALCVEAPQPRGGSETAANLDASSSSPGDPGHGSAALPAALLLALALALAAVAIARAGAGKRLCRGRSYERLSGGGDGDMPHGVPEPDSGDEADVVYTSRGGSVYRRYSLAHQQGGDAEQGEGACLSGS